MPEEKRQDVNDFFKDCILLKEKNSFIKLKQIEAVNQLIAIGLTKEDVFNYVDYYQCYPSTILNRVEFCGKTLNRFKERHEIKRQITVEDAIQFSNDVDFMNTAYTKMPFILIAHMWFLGKGIL